MSLREIDEKVVSTTDRLAKYDFLTKDRRKKSHRKL